MINKYSIDNDFIIDLDINNEDLEKTLLGWNGDNDSFLSKLIGLYWTAHPKYNFFKFAKRDCQFLDLGAGSGGLSTWRCWMNPQRLDIKMHGIDLNEAEHGGNYETFKICNIDFEKIPYDNEFFDYIFMSHIFEHLTDPINACEQLNNILKTGGKIYIELPAVHTYNLPSLTKFRNAGINASTTNFYDDSTHIRTYEIQEIVSMLNKIGNYSMISSGSIYNDYMEDLLIYYGIKLDSTEAITYGI